jgi:hypothetical protein
MQRMWCWRCKREVPMLDGAAEQRHRALEAELAENVDDWDRYERAILANYFEATGFRETNLKAVQHHLASRFGPPCTACGKPLRTPAAAHCAECGAPRSG